MVSLGPDGPANMDVGFFAPMLGYAAGDRDLASFGRRFG
jgi:hypothetical protein